jgi:hypothetical protein
MKYAIVLCITLLFFSCEEPPTERKITSIDDLVELPQEIQAKLKKSKSGNVYFYDPPYTSNEPIPVAQDCRACTCIGSSFVFVIASRIICKPFNAPENAGLKAVPFIANNNEICGVKEYQFTQKLSSINQKMYCFEHSGPWSGTLRITNDCCSATITYELILVDRIVKWYNDLESIPEGIQIVGGSSGVDFGVLNCFNCGGSISDCNGNGFGDDIPDDFDNGI